jgi:flap endonuclease-1
MGIKFKDLFTEYKKEIDLKTLNGKKVGLDAYVLIYQMLARVRMAEQGGQEFSFQGNVTSHLIGIFQRSLYLLENGMKVCAIMDGPPPVMKEKVLKERSKRREEAEKLRQEALDEDDMEAANKYAQASVSVTEQILDDTKKLFNLLGIPVITAVHDAEAQIAQMVRNNTLDSCISQDYDSFAFGAPHIIRNLSVSQRRLIGGKTIVVTPEQYYLEEILTGLNISRDQLILAGLLIGTDFNNGIRGIGPKTALKLVKEYPTLEVLRPHIEEKFITGDYSWDFYFPTEAEDIMEYFKNPPFDETKEIKFNRVDQKAITEFLVDERGFNADNVANRLKKIMKMQKQSSLTSFF